VTTRESAPAWAVEQIPDLTGKRALVTGVTAGIGEHTVLELARKGAEVIMAARTESKLSSTIDDVRRTLPKATVVPLICDLADLSSVRRAAMEAAASGPLDILVNNAGVMATPNRRTVDGFDLQLATNHLGHFALTGLLFPQLVASGDARIVTLASLAHHWVRSIPLNDPREPSGRYLKWVAYARSKLANLLFAFELDRRARRFGLPVTSVAAHPGYAATELMSGGLRLGGRTPVGTMIEAATRLLGQTSAQGALPSLMAATMPGLPGGSYVGPGGPGEMRGAPVIVGTTKAARNEEMAAQLWDLSEQATGVRFPEVLSAG